MIESKVRWTDGQTYLQPNGRTDGQTDGRKDGETEERKDCTRTLSRRTEEFVDLQLENRTTLCSDLRFTAPELNDIDSHNGAS